MTRKSFRAIVLVAIAIIFSGCGAYTATIGEKVFATFPRIPVAKVKVLNTTPCTVDVFLVTANVVDIFNLGKQDELFELEGGESTNYLFNGSGDEFLLLAAGRCGSGFIGTTRRRYCGPDWAGTSDAWVLTTSQFELEPEEEVPCYNFNRRNGQVTYDWSTGGSLYGNPGPIRTRGRR